MTKLDDDIVAETVLRVALCVFSLYMRVNGCYTSMRASSDDVEQEEELTDLTRIGIESRTHRKSVLDP